ncbi:MAG: trigger factor [Planctomycetaceae bacterium]|jgi:trigger factor|nr:trigger factor [Planctomycetaceae bacterium]
MATATDSQLDVEITVTETAPCTKQIRLRVPASAVNARVDMAMATFMADASLPGFRKGKAPKALLEKRFGPAIVQETRQQVMSEAYSRAVEEHKLRPITDPRPVAGETVPELARGSDFAFSVEIEVAPEFDLPDFSGFDVRKPTIEVTNEHVDGEILRQSYRWGTPERIEGPFENLDRMLGKAVVTVDGRDGNYFEAEKALCVVPAKEDEGKGALLGLIFDNLDKALIGKKVGDTVKVSTTGSDSHEREELRGKKITVEYAIAEAERITPRSAKELAEMYGVESEEIFREQVKDALEQRRDGEQRSAMREQISEQLVAKIDFALPAKLSEEQATRTLEQQRMELLSRGVDPASVETRIAELRGKSEKVAKDRLKLFFIMARLAEHFGVQVTEQELNGRIAMMAAQQNMRPEQMRAQIEKAGRGGEVVSMIRDAKVADRIISQAKVSDIAADEWNKLVEAKAKA